MKDVHVLHEAAQGRHGIVTREQAAEIGLSRHGVAYRLATRQWETARRAVYRVAGSVPTWEQKMTALLAAVGPGAVASHRSAAALLRLPGFGRDLLEVITPRDRRHRRPRDAVVHRSRTLPPHHVKVVEGIPTTSIARTLVDLAAVVHPARAERAVDNALTSGLTTATALEAMVAELSSRGRTGIALMRQIVAERNDGEPAPQSELEARFVRVVRDAGLPAPARQLEVGDRDRWVGRVDFAYPEAKLVIELDGRRYHSSKSDLEADHERDNRLVAGGWRVLRVSWRTMVDRPDRVIDLLRRAVADLPRSGNG